MRKYGSPVKIEKIYEGQQEKEETAKVAASPVVPQDKRSPEGKTVASPHSDKKE